MWTYYQSSNLINPQRTDSNISLPLAQRFNGGNVPLRQSNVAEERYHQLVAAAQKKYTYITLGAPPVQIVNFDSYTAAPDLASLSAGQLQLLNPTAPQSQVDTINEQLNQHEDVREGGILVEGECRRAIHG